MRFKNNKNTIFFIMLSILFISLILFVLYELEEYKLYEKIGNSILSIVIYYLLLAIIIAIVVMKGYRLILTHFNIGSKKIEFTKEEKKRYDYLIIGLTLFMLIIDNLLDFDDIEPVFLKIIVKSCFATICLLIGFKIGIKYIDKSTEERDVDS